MHRARHILLPVIILAALLPGIHVAVASPVTLEEAEVLAQYYLWVAPPPEIQGVPEARLGPSRSLRSNRARRDVGFVFTIQPIGYLVISADTRIVPLVAYSGTSNFQADTQIVPLAAYSETSNFQGDEDPENALLDILLFDLTNRLEAAEARMIPSADRNEQMWEEILAEPEPLSASPFHYASHAMGYINRRYSGTGRSIAFPNDWHQRDPYNGQCPEHPAESGSHCRVGCVALAMAQIIAHYRCPKSVFIAQGTSYKVEGNDRTLGSSMRYSFRYPPNPTSALETDVAKVLCAAAGLSVNTEYAIESSVAVLSDAAAALKDTWQYRSAVVRGLNACPGGPTTVPKNDFAWELRSEASDGRPVLLSLSGESARHAVVCDGWQQETTDAGHVDRFHLRMGGVGSGTDSWYNLPEELPEPFSVLCYGIFDIRPPIDCAATAYGLALRVNKGCEVQYDSGETIEIIYTVDSASRVDLFDFDPSDPGSPRLFPRGYEGAGGHSLSGVVIGTGVEVIVVRAISGTTVQMAACRVPVGVSPSLLESAWLTTQHGCDAFLSTGERLVVEYSVSIPVSNVWIYVVTAQGVTSLTSAPLGEMQGRITSSNTIGPIKGDRMLVLVATTDQGTVAATCKYTVP